MELFIAVVLTGFLVAYLQADKVAGMVGSPAVTVKSVAGIAVLVAIVLLSLATGVLGSLLLTGVKLVWFGFWVGAAALAAIGITKLLKR